MIDAPPQLVNRRQLLSTAGAAVLPGGFILADGLNVLGRMPQGAPQIHTHDYESEVDHAHPLNLRVYLDSDIRILNRARLSFFIEAFRSPVAGVNTATSGASSASSSGASSATT